MKAFRSECLHCGAYGRKPCVVPGGASTQLGTLGYVACTQEILAKNFERGLRIGRIVCASGSGVTHAGLLAEFIGSNARIPVTGMSVRHPRER